MLASVTKTTTAGLVASRYARVQGRVLAAVRDVDDETMRYRPDGTNSIGFNVWHLARWADQLAFIIPLMSPDLGRALGAYEQIWLRDRLSQARIVACHADVIPEQLTETPMQLARRSWSRSKFPTHTPTVTSRVYPIVQLS